MFTNHKSTSGFTLIELVAVVVILGVLAIAAIPKFVDLGENAEHAMFKTMAAAFSSGVQQVHLKWRIEGNGQAQLNFIPIADPSVGGDLSVNEFGYPADTRGVSLTMNSADDCLDVWRAVLISQDAQVAADNSADLQASYTNETCTFVYNSNTSLSVFYNSNTGEISING